MNSKSLHPHDFVFNQETSLTCACEKDQLKNFQLFHKAKNCKRGRFLSLISYIIYMLSVCIYFTKTLSFCLPHSWLSVVRNATLYYFVIWAGLFFVAFRFVWSLLWKYTPLWKYHAIGLWKFGCFYMLIVEVCAIVYVNQSLGRCIAINVVWIWGEKGWFLGDHMFYEYFSKLAFSK